ncbi:unnamed protein product [Prunus armeniaca]|uniref:Uncharacterized protein n=1 Tax=Prunus armeniaca TaxID=36596 RepID=A0A6J5XYX0_PRUAR|nr:unnamed protein product [Prunus armeniaca]
MHNVTALIEYQKLEGWFVVAYLLWVVFGFGTTCLTCASTESHVLVGIHSWKDKAGSREARWSCHWNLTSIFIWTVTSHGLQECVEIPMYQSISILCFSVLLLVGERNKREWMHPQGIKKCPVLSILKSAMRRKAASMLVCLHCVAVSAAMRLVNVV